MEWVWAIMGVAGGGVAGWLVARALAKSRLEQAVTAATAEAKSIEAALAERIAGKDEQVVSLQEHILQLTGELNDARTENLDLHTERERLLTTLENQKKSVDEKLALLEDARTQLSDAFKALSSDALQRNNQQFLEMARQTIEKSHQQSTGDLDKRQQAFEGLIKPIRETLEKFDFKIGDIEKARKEAYGSLNQQVQSLVETQDRLRSETGKLVQALRTPQARGRWGEIQLERVAELAGMTAYCDFDTQVSIKTEDRGLRPDMVVNLPAGKNIVVDAKAPLDAYLNAVEAPDEAARERFIADHARHIRDHIKKLGAKNYWDNLKVTPEFVVLFLPGENFFSAALQVDPDLIQQGIANRVILSTPTTLIALLKAVAYGWRNEQLAENAQQISTLGKELYERLATMSDHIAKLGACLKQAVVNYNATIGSLETRVLTSARKFQELGVVVKNGMRELSDVDQTPRELHAMELTEAGAKKQLGLGLEEGGKEEEEEEKATEGTECTESS